MSGEIRVKPPGVCRKELHLRLADTGRAQGIEDGRWGFSGEAIGYLKPKEERVRGGRKCPEAAAN